MFDKLWVRVGALTALFAVVDLATKIWAAAELHGAGIDLPGPLDLRLSHNDGIAFGILDNLPPFAIVALTGVMAATILVVGARGAAPLVPCALIAGGAIGNVLDRLEAGSVVDMLHTSFWPTFNLADVFITTGIAAWLLSNRRVDRPAPKTVTAPSTSGPSALPPTCGPGAP